MIRFSHVSSDSPHSRIGINNLSFHVSAGEIVIFSGSPESGVSLLCDLCVGYVHPRNGRISIGGYDTADGRERIHIARRLLVGAVSSRIPLIENRSVLDNVCLPLEIRGRPFGKTVRSAMNALHALGVVNIRRQKPAGLSADERFLVSVARAIVSLPRIIVVDECESGSYRNSLVNHPELLRTMSAWGAAVLIASHEYPEFHNIELKIVSMDNGTISGIEVKKPEGSSVSRSYLMDLLLKNSLTA